MRKIFFVVLLLVISFGAVEQLSARSLQSIEETFEVDEHQKLSIKQAIELASPSALKWDENVQLLTAMNIDLEDKAEKSIGSNGKRKYWNIAFGVPDTNKYFLVTIHKGEIVGAEDHTKDGSSPYLKNELVVLEDIKYDSPQLLKKALKLDAINPGNDWAKGYSFIIRKDPETDISLMLVIGWNKELDNMVAVYFDATNGKHLVTSN